RSVRCACSRTAGFLYLSVRHSPLFNGGFTGRSWSSVDFAWCDRHADALREIFHAVSRDGFVESRWWLNDRRFLRLHPTFAGLEKGGSPVVSRWAKQFPARSGIRWIRYLGRNNSLWQVVDLFEF